MAEQLQIISVCCNYVLECLCATRKVYPGCHECREERVLFCCSEWVARLHCVTISVCSVGRSHSRRYSFPRETTLSASFTRKWYSGNQRRMSVVMACLVCDPALPNYCTLNIAFIIFRSQRNCRTLIDNDSLLKLSLKLFNIDGFFLFARVIGEELWKCNAMSTIICGRWCECRHPLVVTEQVLPQGLVHCVLFIVSSHKALWHLT